MAQKQHRPPPKQWKQLRASVIQLRQNETRAEVKLWHLLRCRKFEGYKFRRQVGIDRFVVDFYCAKAHLIIELDGTIHQTQVEADQEREEILKGMGFHVLRFSNEQVYNQIDDVLNNIFERLLKPDM